MQAIVIKIPQREKLRLERLALRYGLSIAELSRRVLSEVSSDLEEESFKDYIKPRALQASFDRAVRDYRHGRVSTKL